MDKLEKYEKRKALAYANYMARLNEATRMARAARSIYDKDLADALQEYQNRQED